MTRLRLLEDAGRTWSGPVGGWGGTGGSEEGSDLRAVSEQASEGIGVNRAAFW